MEKKRFFCSLFFSFLLYVGRSKSYRPNGEKRKTRVNTYLIEVQTGAIIILFSRSFVLSSLSLRHRLCLLAERLYRWRLAPPKLPPLIEGTAYPSPGFLFSSDGELKSHYCIDTHTRACHSSLICRAADYNQQPDSACVCYTRRRRKVI